MNLIHISNPSLLLVITCLFCQAQTEEDARRKYFACLNACNVPIGHTHDPNDEDGPCKPSPSASCACHCACDNAYLTLTEQSSTMQNTMSNSSGSEPNFGNSKQDQQGDRQKEELIQQINSSVSRQQAMMNRVTTSIGSIGDFFQRKLTNDRIEEMNNERENAFNELQRQVQYGGSLISCTICNGEGLYDCDECYGRGSFECEVCDGEGAQTCGVCSGTGIFGGTLTCSTCGGSGEKTCPTCFGNGNTRCSFCLSLGHLNCTSCGGAGLEYKSR